jgi:putative hydrolase of the HAD superfamily
MTYRAVFFDAGETLVHPQPSFADVFVDVLKEAGVNPVPARSEVDTILISQRFAEAARDGVLWTTSVERSRSFWLGVYETFLQQAGLERYPGLPELLYARFTDLSTYALFDDVPGALESLRHAGMIMGVVSNYEEWLERLLGSLDVARYFAVRVISGVEGIEKPDLRLFRLALERAAVAPAETVYVGDSPVFDIEPAEEIGMRGVLIDRRNRFPEHRGARIASMDQLPALIGLER